MRIFTAVLLFLATTAYAEHAGRGLVRHSPVGNTVCQEPHGEIVELPPAPQKAAAPVLKAAPVESIAVFAAAEDVPALRAARIPDAFVPPVRAEVLETTSPAPVTLFHADLYKPSPHPVAVVKANEPTTEQLRMMRELRLSLPPTILNSDGTVRAVGHGYKGAALLAPSVPYCPECQRRRG